MLTPQHLAALGFAVSRARAFTEPDKAPEIACTAISQAEEVLDVLRVRIEAAAARRVAALAELHRVDDMINADHPFGKAETLACLARAQALIANEGTAT